MKNPGRAPEEADATAVSAIEAKAAANCYHTVGKAA